MVERAEETSTYSWSRYVVHEKNFQSFLCIVGTGSISPLVSDEGIAGIARRDSRYLFLMFDGTGLHWTNGSSLLGKILTNKNPH